MSAMCQRVAVVVPGTASSSCRPCNVWRTAWRPSVHFYPRRFSARSTLSPMAWPTFALGCTVIRKDRRHQNYIITNNKHKECLFFFFSLIFCCCCYKLHMYVFRTTYARTHTHAHTQARHSRTHRHARTHVHTHTNAHIHTHTHTHTRARARARTHARTN